MDSLNAIDDNRRWLWSVVYARMGDRCSTEDVLQEVFSAAFQNRHRLSEIQEIRGWLYQVAIRQVLQFRRRESRYRKRLQSYAQMRFADGELTLLEQLSGSEQQERVRAALWNIPASDRQVLLLKYCEDLSCREIATHMGVTETTIQSRLLRARRRLKGQLVNNDGEQTDHDKPR